MEEEKGGGKTHHEATREGSGLAGEELAGGRPLAYELTCCGILWLGSICTTG